MTKRFCQFVMWMCVLAPAAALGQTPAGEGGAQAALRDIRLASFSPQRAFSESAEGKAGIARLTALQTEKARQIDEKNKALQTRSRRSSGAHSRSAMRPVFGAPARSSNSASTCSDSFRTRRRR